MSFTELGLPFGIQTATAKVPNHLLPSSRHLSSVYPISQSTNNHSHIANHPGTQSLFQPPKELGAGLLQMKTHGRLQDTKGEDSLVKRDRFRLPCHKFTGHLKPGFSQTALFDPLRETETLQDPAKQIRWSAHVSLKIKRFPHPAKLPEYLGSNGISSRKPATASTPP